MRKATDFAVLPGGTLKVQVSEGMRLGRARFDLRGFQELLANQMRQLSLHRAHTQVDGRLTKIAGQQLGMAVSHVQQMHIASFGQVIQAACLCSRARMQWKTNAKGSRHNA